MINAPSVTVYRMPASGPVSTSKELYYNRNRIAFEIEKKENDGVLEDPVTMEEMPEYVPGKTISYLRLTDKNVPVGMRFFTLESLEQCLARNNKDPFTNQPWKSAMRQRVEIAVKARRHAPRELAQEEISPLFMEFISDPEVFKSNRTVEYDLLRQNLHIGDAGILSSWGAINDDSLRAKAIETLENAEQGSWLIRNSSVKSTNLVTIQALSYVITPKMKTVPAKIHHSLIMHVRGLGYAIPEAERNQKMPDLNTKDIPLPIYENPLGSVLDILEWFHMNATNFKLSKMICAI